MRDVNKVRKVGVEVASPRERGREGEERKGRRGTRGSMRKKKGEGQEEDGEGGKFSEAFFTRAFRSAPLFVPSPRIWSNDDDSGRRISRA